VIGYRQCRHFEFFRPCDKSFDPGCTVEKRILCVTVQMAEIHMIKKTRLAYWKRQDWTEKGALIGG